MTFNFPLPFMGEEIGIRFVKIIAVVLVKRNSHAYLLFENLNTSFTHKKTRKLINGLCELIRRTGSRFGCKTWSKLCSNKRKQDHRSFVTRIYFRRGVGRQMCIITESYLCTVNTILQTQLISRSPQVAGRIYEGWRCNEQKVKFTDMNHPQSGWRKVVRAKFICFSHLASPTRLWVCGRKFERSTRRAAEAKTNEIYFQYTMSIA